MFKNLFSKKRFDAIKEAEAIVNTHSYEICNLCRKKGCENYCLPVEMFVQITQEPDEKKLEMLRNVENMFTDTV